MHSGFVAISNGSDEGRPTKVALRAVSSTKPTPPRKITRGAAGESCFLRVGLMRVTLVESRYSCVTVPRWLHYSYQHHRQQQRWQRSRCAYPPPKFPPHIAPPLTAPFLLSKNQAVVKTVDMEPAMEQDAIEVATYALNEFVVEKEMANYIKKEFDKKYRCERAAAPPPRNVSSTFSLRVCRAHALSLLSSAFLPSCAARHGTSSSARITAHMWSTRPRTLSTFTLGRRPS